MIISLFALEILKILQNQSCNFCLLHQPWKGYQEPVGHVTCDLFEVELSQLNPKTWGKGRNQNGRQL